MNNIFKAFAPLGNGKDLLVDPLLVEIAKKKAKSPAQVSLHHHDHGLGQKTCPGVPPVGLADGGGHSHQD